jgi:soluble lytic murein transglycosylase-like protein
MTVLTKFAASIGVIVLVLSTIVGTGMLAPKDGVAQTKGVTQEPVELQVSAEIGLNVRTGPGMEYEIITALPFATTVVEIDRSGDWVKVNYDGEKGWSHGNWLVEAGSLRAVEAEVEELPETGGYAAPSGVCVDSTWNSVDCAPDYIAEAIFSAAAYYGVDPWVLARVAACESHFDPYAVGAAGEIGLFQWFTDEWAAYGSGDIWNVWDQAYATAWSFANGRASHWVCYGRL